MIELVEGKKNLVIKRDGRLEEYNPEKMRKVILWASEGSEVFTNQLLEAIDIKIHNKISIEKLYDEVIDTASNLISDLFPHWERIAKNLYLLKLHKMLGVKRSEYPDYKEIVENNIASGFYNPDVIENVDIERLGIEINPEYDKLFTFSGLFLFVDKYCNKVKNRLLELPQHTYMRIAIQLMYKDGTDDIIKKYHQLAKMQVTEATPKVVNSLKKNASMFSCCLVRPSDSLEGINESINMLSKESKFSGGVAWDSSLIRGPGAVVDGNKGKSLGAKPYIQAYQWTISGYNQGSTRSSAGICTFDAFHYESPEKAILKNETGKDEDRARRLQYSVKWNNYLSKAVVNNEDIYLVDPHKCQDLFNSYGEEWKTLYEKVVRNTHISKRKYNSRELAFEFAKTAFETGNLYFFFSDNANEQDIGAGFIPASNLCQEMIMSYEPITQVDAKLEGDIAYFKFEGDIALCNLASINLGEWVKLEDDESKADFMYLLVKSADNAIENSFYVNPLGEKHSKSHRNLGIGTSNYAYVLAKNHFKWNSEEARRFTHELYEEISFYAIKASIQLAKERSRCGVWKDTKWSEGLFPHELSKLSKMESELNYPLKMDWESLRPELLKYGIRNSRILAIAPTATSGKCINATEGVDAPRKLKTIVEGTYSLPFMVPEVRELREHYETMFNISNKDVIELAAIRQKFLCMSQSLSLAYESSKSAFEFVSNVIKAEELGLKTLYYTYTRKAEETIEEEGCDSCGS